MRPSIKPSLSPTKKPTHEPSRSTGRPTVSESVNITVIVEGGKYEGGLQSHNLFVVQPVALSRVEIEGGGQMNTYRIRSEGVRDVIVVIRDFDESKDVLDLRLFSNIKSMDDLSYTSPPLTLVLANNIKVVLVSSVSMNLKVDQNILLSDDYMTENSSEGFVFFSDDLITSLAILTGCMLFVYVFVYYSSGTEIRKAEHLMRDRILPEENNFISQVNNQLVNVSIPPEECPADLVNIEDSIKQEVSDEDYAISVTSSLRDHIKSSFVQSLESNSIENPKSSPSCSSFDISDEFSNFSDQESFRSFISI
jgi:hypothetical protein